MISAARSTAALALRGLSHRHLSIYCHQRLTWMQPSLHQPSSLFVQAPQHPYHQRPPNPLPNFRDHKMPKARHSQPRANQGERCLYQVRKRKREQCSMPCMHHICSPVVSNRTDDASQYNLGSNRQLGPSRLPLAHDLRARLLRHRDDAPFHTSLRPRPSRYNLPCFTTPV